MFAKVACKTSSLIGAIAAISEDVL
jgi:hypothetical protein